MHARVAARERDICVVDEGERLIATGEAKGEIAHLCALAAGVAVGEPSYVCALLVEGKYGAKVNGLDGVYQR